MIIVACCTWQMAQMPGPCPHDRRRDVFQVACCMLHVACCMLHVAAASGSLRRQALEFRPRVERDMLHVALGKWLRCLDPVLTIAAAMSFKSPFVAPLDKRDEADRARLSFEVCCSLHFACCAHDKHHEDGACACCSKWAVATGYWGSVTCNRVPPLHTVTNNRTHVGTE